MKTLKNLSIMKLFFLFFISALLMSCDMQGCSVIYNGTAIPDLNCDGIAGPEDIANANRVPVGGNNQVIRYSLTSARLVTPRNELPGLDYNSKSVPVDIDPIDQRVDMRPYSNYRTENHVTLSFDIGLRNVDGSVNPIEAVVDRAFLSRIALDPSSKLYKIEYSDVPYGHRRMVQAVDQDGNTIFVLPNDGQGYNYRLM